MQSRLFYLVALLVMSSQTFAQSWGDKGANKKAVIVEKLIYQTQKSSLEAVGTAEAVKSVTLFPAVSERVVTVNFKPGQRVKKSQVLMMLYSERQSVTLERAKIEFKDAARKNLLLVESIKKGAASQSELDDSITTLALANIAVKEAKIALDERIIRAPFAGVVGLTDIQAGDRVNLQSVITTIDDRQALFINFTAPEIAIDLLSQQPQVQLVPWQNRLVTIEASIAQVDSRINEQDRTIRVRALLDNSEDSYRPGMSFRVNLTVPGQDYIAVPEAALLWSATGAYVWQMVDGKAIRVDVKIRERLRGTILVAGEFNLTAPLVVEGVQQLRQGQALKAQNTSNEYVAKEVEGE
ncbi:efflux RND transporter periplasmic adaptor subunit [Colwellia sp. C1TZA3]|uniref:efflux RND transporter periplasmic adaptor subunit n=1 Tax=Colwellia sp. C1TZA3 TaxID=2508879 RepID=UPI0011BA02B5|nr:efflux RND transporter periplasmic adaptor subunit [Colwellia sp. C1TZA3]TWX73409.1 efflux RND transporter periplasmic adaptor subunit [Colwellia sp. C1TZA3]